jgi:hypothetical protein
VHEPLLQAFPFPSTLEVVLHSPSLACVFIYSSCGKCPSPPIGVFLTWPLLQVFLLQDRWVCAATPAFSGRLVYLQIHEGLPSPSFRCAGHPALFTTCPFCCYCLLFSLAFFLFSLGGGQSVQGAMLVWPRVVCGSTMCHFAHLVACFSQASRSCHLAAWEPSWFLHLPWSGDAMHRLGCG